MKGTLTQGGEADRGDWVREKRQDTGSGKRDWVSEGKGRETDEEDTGSGRKDR